MNVIVAADKNWAIGAKNDLLYRLPYDLSVNFKGRTLNKTIVIGSNTLKSFPHSRPLKNRTNIVLCNTGEIFDGCVNVSTLEELFKVLHDYDTDEIFVCGGASIYKLLYEYCDTAVITKVDAESAEATAFFPNLDEEENWTIAEKSPPILDNGYTITICIYKNNSPKPY